MPDPMAPWLRRHLENQGHIDPTTGATENVRITHCDTCRRPTWVGLEPRGFARQLDPSPLTPIGEALAILQGRNASGMYRAGNRLEIELRTLDRIRNHPAGTPNTDVLLEHRCHNPGHHLPRTTTALTWPTARPPITGEPF